MGLISIDTPLVLYGSIALSVLVFALFYLICYQITIRAYLRTVA